MKLLLDENLSWRMIKKLKPFFEEVIHASELKIIQPADDIPISLKSNSLKDGNLSS